ncbi:MAG: penicillin-binding protein 1A [Halieaceae bacterium]|nr:penicillin-binding protein 1A [Halieaceae bacterium]
MKAIRPILRLLLAGLLASLLLCAGVYLYLSPQLPSVEVLRDVRLQVPMQVYTRDGQLIGQFGEQKRNPLPFEEVPPRFVQALLAAEDDGFFTHPGVSLRGLLRAAIQLVTTGEKKTGGSTLTMQVARNYFLTHERSFTRKFKEILLSLKIERSLNKEEIFELYFNRIFLGHRAYGFEAAAQVYYGSSIGELNLAQAAMLAGLPKAPSSNNPLSDAERALVRRNWILGRMLELGYIEASDYQEAVSAPVTAEHHGARLALAAPYAAEMVRREMIRRYGLAAYSDGYHAFTSIDSGLQQAANAAVREGIDAYDQRHGYRGPEQQIPPQPQAQMTELWLAALKQTPSIGGRLPGIVTTVADDHLEVLLRGGGIEVLPWENGLRQARPHLSENRRGPAPKTPHELWAAGDLIRLRRDLDGSLWLTQMPAVQAALIALDVNNGAILSMVGGSGFETSKFNRAVQAARQPGSNFKPFIYAAALANGYTAASIINDAPVVFEDAALEGIWRPQNDDGKFYGPTRLRWALTKSRNLVSIRLLEQLGIRTAIQYLDRFGFDLDASTADLSLALGSQSVTPLQLARAYASLANGGYQVDSWLLARVEDFHRNEVYTASPASVCHACENPAASTAEERELSMEEILAAGRSPAPPVAKRIVDASTAFIIDSILQDVITRGTGRRARALNRSDIAGKTGTTNGPTDAWFSGYNPSLVATAWVGFDQNLPLGNNEFGGVAALPIWMDFMRVALSGKPEEPRRIPDGMVSVRIDPKTGLLASPGQTDAIFEYFQAGLEPAGSSAADAMDATDADLRKELF